MDRQRIQVSKEEPVVRRRKKAITSSSGASMDQITVEFVLPTATWGSSADSLQLEVAGNWTVEQVADCSEEL